MWFKVYQDFARVGYDGADRFLFGIGGGPTLLDTTFSNHEPGNTPSDSTNGLQAYPDAFPGGSYPAFTGSIEHNTLGYYHPNPALGPMDAVYHIERTFEHAGGALDLRDAGALLAAGDREALIAEVEGRLSDVRPDAREAWRQVLAMEP